MRSSTLLAAWMVTFSSAIGAEAAGWTPAAPMTTPRIEAQALVLSTGEVLVFGGSPTDDLQTADIYDPSTDSWRRTAPALWHSWMFLFELGDGRVLAVTSDWTGIYATVADEWRIGPGPGPLFYFAASLLPGDRAMVTGGLDFDRFQVPAVGRNPHEDLFRIWVGQFVTRRTRIFDVVTETWGDGPPARDARFLHSQVTLADGDALIFDGGMRNGHGLTLSSCERFGADGTWRHDSTMVQRRAFPVVARLTDGRLLACGGAEGNTVSQVSDATCEIYDPTRRSWRSTGAYPSPRGFWPQLGLAALPDGGAVVAGGWTETGPISETLVWSAANETWTAGPRLATSRGGHVTVVLPDGRVMVAGGSDAAGEVLSSVEIWSR